MRRLFEQACSMGFQSSAMRGGLAGKLGLNFRPDVNGDGRAMASVKIIVEPDAYAYHNPASRSADPAASSQRAVRAARLNR